MTAILLAGLGFGDEGKGSMVDFLVRETKAHTVIRYNGGAQAAHNVVTPDGRHHTFAQFGSGTLAGANTYLSEYMLVNPFALLAEAKHLESIGVSNPLTRVKINKWASITTPFHVAANRLQEMARGDARHGSCGMGIGETVRLQLRHGFRFPASYCSAPKLGAISLRAIQGILLLETEEIRKTLPQTEAVMRERHVLEDPDLTYILDTYATIAPMLVDHDYERQLLCQYGSTIFEGAQGMLLDQDFGFHPHTTWSDISFRNAEAMIERSGSTHLVEKIGVLRAHLTRHGAGPFPTEDKTLSIPTDHNSYGEWQQNFRVGMFDFVLARYALAAIGGVDGVALTHLDMIQTFNTAHLEYEDRETGYPVSDLRRPQGRSDTAERLSDQEKLGISITEKLRPAGKIKLDSRANLPRMIRQQMQTRVWMESFGPTAKDKRLM